MSPPRHSVWELVKEEIDGGNFAVPDDYEIGSGVSWWPARAARYPPDPTAIAYLLRRGERLILEVRMSSLDHACDAVDLVTAMVSTVRFVEHSVFVEDLSSIAARRRTGSISPNTSWRLRSNKVDAVWGMIFSRVSLQAEGDLSAAASTSRSRLGGRPPSRSTSPVTMSNTPAAKLTWMPVTMSTAPAGRPACVSPTRNCCSVMTRNTSGRPVVSAMMPARSAPDRRSGP